MFRKTTRLTYPFTYNHTPNLLKIMEDRLILKIENGIRAIKLGAKTIQEANINAQLEQLKKTNLGLAEDLQKQYVEVVKNLKK